MDKEKKTRNVTITLTQSCNLDCSYCYENHKSEKRMSYETAIRIINDEFENCDKYDAVEIDFFGGEPFIEFNLIQRVVDYVCRQNYSKPYTFFASTNGTLVHGDIQNWLIDHPCFICGLSLDGTRDMHNINRSNSFDVIDIDFFLNYYPDQDIKMTVSKETLPNLAEGVIYLHNLGFKVSCNLAFGIDWSDTENLENLQLELNKLIDYYLDNPEIEPCSMLNMGISNVAFSGNKYIRVCGSGIDMAAYDIDGTKYPCQFFMPLSVGEKKARDSADIIFYDKEIPPELIDPKCKNCVIQPVCRTCYGANYASTGNIYIHDPSMCELTKIEIKARSFFKAKQWELGQLKLDKEEEQALLKSIMLIQENI